MGSNWLKELNFALWLDTIFFPLAIRISQQQPPLFVYLESLVSGFFPLSSQVVS